MKTGDHDEGSFDDLARAAHARSLDALSPRTRAQLQVRRRAAASSAGMRLRSAAWPLAATACAVTALAIGWQLRGPAPGPAATPVAVPVAALPQDDSATLVLDENPELYAWLASSDAATLAME